MEKESKLDKILRSIAKVHDVMATKEDLSTLATKQELARLATKEDLEPIQNDIRAIKTDVEELRTGAFTELDKEDLLGRIKYVEQRLGIESGK